MLLQYILPNDMLINMVHFDNVQCGNNRPATQQSYNSNTLLLP